MCGIAGFIGLDRPEETQYNYLKAMIQAIHHRDLFLLHYLSDRPLSSSFQKWKRAADLPGEI